mmetsp:Transcript_32040/g.95314  ORF Transcript_32040/g.95314 Transcript_32040/m.95314 type:complete len:376 (-) Transcript_32040:141-1268(-)
MQAKVTLVTAPAPERRAQASRLGELLDGVLARVELGGNDADGREHREAAVVELTVARVLVVLVQAHRVAEVTRRLALALAPGAQLQSARDRKERDEAVAAGGRVRGAKASGDALEAGELHEVLDHGAQGGHHGDTAVLDLGRAVVPEGLLIALLAEAEGVEEAKRRRGTDLEGRVEDLAGLLEELVGQGHQGVVEAGLALVGVVLISEVAVRVARRPDLPVLLLARRLRRLDGLVPRGAAVLDVERLVRQAVIGARIRGLLHRAGRGRAGHRRAGLHGTRGSPSGLGRSGGRGARGSRGDRLRTERRARLAPGDGRRGQHRRRGEAHQSRAALGGTGGRGLGRRRAAQRLRLGERASNRRLDAWNEGPRGQQARA